MQELAKAYLAELAAGSSPRDLLQRLTCPVALTTVQHQTESEGILMVGDSGTELHVVSKNDRGYMINERDRIPPCVLDTENGKIALDVEGYVMFDGILLKDCA